MAEVQSSPTNALSTDEERLRFVEARLQMLQNLTPDCTEIARLESVRNDLKSRL